MTDDVTVQDALGAEVVFLTEADDDGVQMAVNAPTVWQPETVTDLADQAQVTGEAWPNHAAGARGWRGVFRAFAYAAAGGDLFIDLWDGAQWRCCYESVVPVGDPGLFAAVPAMAGQYRARLKNTSGGEALANSFSLMTAFAPGAAV